MNITKKTAILTLSSLFSLPVVAANEDVSGWWIGGAGGLGFIEGQDLETDNKIAPAIIIDGGFDFNQYIGVYTSYEYMYELGNEKLSIGTLGLKGSYEFADRWSVFGKVGTSYIRNGNELGKVKKESYSGTLGLGVEYQITNAISTKLGYDYFDDLTLTDGGSSNLHQTYWGMEYKFGRKPDVRVVREIIKVEQPKEIQEVIVKEIQEVPVEVAVPVVELSKTNYLVTFGTGKSDILSDSDNAYYLDEVVNTMEKYSQLTVHLVGRADQIGSVAVNQRVSAKRAQAVKDYLIASGVDSKRITLKAVGMLKPLKDNNTSDKSSTERSVELILKQETVIKSV